MTNTFQFRHEWIWVLRSATITEREVRSRIWVFLPSPSCQKDSILFSSTIFSVYLEHFCLSRWDLRMDNFFFLILFFRHFRGGEIVVRCLVFTEYQLHSISCQGDLYHLSDLMYFKGAYFFLNMGFITLFYNTQFYNTEGLVLAKSFFLLTWLLPPRLIMRMTKMRLLHYLTPWLPKYGSDCSLGKRKIWEF